MFMFQVFFVYTDIHQTSVLYFIFITKVAVHSLSPCHPLVLLLYRIKLTNQQKHLREKITKQLSLSHRMHNPSPREKLKKKEPGGNMLSIVVL